MDLGVVSNFLLPEQTQTINFLGTIRYADPSYLTGGQFTSVSDWYSLGLIGYELFFGTRFVDFEEQWARLVAHKVRARLPSEDDFAHNYQELSELSGQNASEATFYALKTLLIEPTQQRLQRLRNAISSEFWLKPFYEQKNGELVPGEPAEVPAFRFARWYGGYTPEDSYDSLETARQRLLAIFSDREEARDLPSYLKTNYWKWKVSGLDNIHDLGAKPIDTYWIYASGGGDDTTYDYLYINAGIMALYRYGYL